MRLEVTRRSDLAVRALIVLAAARGRVKAKALADELDTTVAYVPQVLNPLVSRGWVRSHPGPTGGYSAAVPLAELNVLDVIEATEGPTITGRCVLENVPCRADAPCALHGAWENARTRLLDALADTTVGELGEPR
ncbi:MAG: RrF2 family transcriptional regulator [Acidimicrobiia bacterium]